MATFPPAALSVSGAAGERRRLGAFDSRTSCQSGRGLGTGPFFPRENGSPLRKTRPRDPTAEWEFGGRQEGRVGRDLPRATLTCSRLSAVHKASPAPWLSIALGGHHPDPAQGLGRGAAPTAAAGATCCARSARPAGAQRFPPGWRRAGAAAAAAAAAAAPGRLRTREAAGAGSAPPFPRCHADPRCLAPGPGRGLPQSKGNFLVSRQRNNAPAREGAPRSQRLRLPRGPEAGRAAPAAPRRRLPGRGSRLRPPSSAASSFSSLPRLSLFPTRWSSSPPS